MSFHNYLGQIRILKNPNLYFRMEPFPSNLCHIHLTQPALPEIQSHHHTTSSILSFHGSMFDLKLMFGLWCPKRWWNCWPVGKRISLNTSEAICVMQCLYVSCAVCGTRNSRTFGNFDSTRVEIVFTASSLFDFWSFVILGYIFRRHLLSIALVLRQCLFFLIYSFTC